MWPLIKCAPKTVWVFATEGARKRGMLPPGKILIPGAVTHSNVMIEHPEAVADHIERWVRVVGVERHLRQRLRFPIDRRQHRDSDDGGMGEASGAGRRRANRIEAPFCSDLMNCSAAHHREA